MSRTFQRGVRTKCSWRYPTLPSNVAANGRIRRMISWCLLDSHKLRGLRFSRDYSHCEGDHCSTHTLVKRPSRPASIWDQVLCRNHWTGRCRFYGSVGLRRRSLRAGMSESLLLACVLAQCLQEFVQPDPLGFRGFAIQSYRIMDHEVYEVICLKRRGLPAVVAEEGVDARRGKEQRRK